MLKVLTIFERSVAKFWKILSYYPISGLSTMKTSHLVKSVAKALKTTQESQDMWMAGVAAFG